MIKKILIMISVASIFLLSNCGENDLIEQDNSEAQIDSVDIADPVDTITVFKTVRSEVVIDAENYSFIGGSGGNFGTWSLQTSEKGYLGKGYMQSSTDKPVDGSHLNFNLATANLNYIINFTDTGKYYVHFRSLAMEHTENGFFAALDSLEVDYGGTNPDDQKKKAYFIYVDWVSDQFTWYWYTDGGGAETRGLKVSFKVEKTGRHTFSVFRRDTGSRIDHIWLTKRESNPQKTATLTLTDPLTYIRYQAK